MFNQKTPISWPQTLLLPRLGAILRAERTTRNVSEQLAATRFRHAVQRAESAGETVRPILELFSVGGLDAIECAKSGTVELNFSDFQLLSEIYDVPRIFLDPSLSKPVEVCCLISFEDSLFVGPKHGGNYGEQCVYSTPDKCLKGGEAASVVRVSIKPGGYSDVHWHSGDELLFVLGGSIEILLLSTGLRAQLKTHDYIHFYSEQEHCALNVSDHEDAEFLVVRLKRSSRRSTLVESLRARSAKRSITSTARQELLASVDPRSANRSGEEVGVLDRSGFGRLLQLLCNDSFREDAKRLTLNTIAKRAKDFKPVFSRARIDRMHHGMSTVPQEELLTLASIYDVHPTLLYDFCFPAYRGAIAVRCQPGEPPLQESDMVPMPSAFVEGSNSNYLVPNKRLADTDVATAFLRLEHGTSSPKNRHPGHEILIPCSGKISLHFDGTSAQVQVGQLVHFHSFRQHWVTNEAEEAVEVFVIRIYS